MQMLMQEAIYLAVTREVASYTEKINSWRITEQFGNREYEKNSVDFTELYTKHTYRNVESKNRFYRILQ